MQQKASRRRQWTRECSQNSTQCSGPIEAGAVRHIEQSSLDSLAANTLHASGRHEATQPQQYAKRSRYCLQLTAGTGATPSLSAASTASHNKRPITAQHAAMQASAALAIDARTAQLVPVKRVVRGSAATKPTHRVYVRGISQPKYQLREPLSSQRPGPQSQQQPPANSQSCHPTSSKGMAITASSKQMLPPTASQHSETTIAKQSHVALHAQQQQQQQHSSRAQQSVQPSRVQQQQGVQQGRTSQTFQDASSTTQQQPQGQPKAPAAAAAAQPQTQQIALQQQLATDESRGKQQGQPGFVPKQPQHRSQPHLLPASSRAPHDLIATQSQRSPLTKLAVRRTAAGPSQLITRPASNGSVKLVYKKNRNKLERTGVQAAVAGASLTWVNEATAPHLAAAAQAAVAATAAAAAAKRLQQRERLQQVQQGRQQHSQKQQQTREQLLQRKRQTAPTAPAGTVPAKPALVRRRRGSAQRVTSVFKLVRIGGQLYYSTPQGICSAASARLLARKSLGYSTAPRHYSTSTAPAAAATGLGVRRPIAKPASSSGAMLAVPPAAAAGVAKRLLSSSAVARSLAIARGRHAAKRAAARRGLCLHYCKRGKCDLALRGQCEKVHDPSKVAVCQQWLAGQCSNTTCKLQHKVVPELMPVCTYFLEGVCSNRDCPYLHVKVAADAPACRAFLQGHCPAGAACTHKHLTHRMAKQQQQQRQLQKRRLTANQPGLAAAAGAAAAAAAPEQTGKLQARCGGAAQVAAGAAAVERRCSESFVMALEHLLPQAEGQ